ncbi:MAG: acyl-CoA dehydrogenase [Alphaproteobacteria bacterium]|nr:acyl-CoA dehydrogenase [Alphaproteobacteria bacterium]
MTKAWIPPLADTRFVLGELIDLDRAIERAGNHVDRPGVDQILDEAARFATDVLTPLDRPGDATGARLENGTVVLPSGFAEAYGRFVEGGWNALASPAAIGGAGVPKALATAVAEYWTSASMAFGLCPLLTQSGIELLARHGTTAQRQTYLPNLVSGRWTATMCLTEAHAGSDVGALRTRAVRQGERWHVRGEKIFITYGDHAMAENIVHLVLARPEGAPAGNKGLALFAVPKFIPDRSGAPGRRNDLRVMRLEHKLGIHASPTCHMAFGEAEGAEGELVGAEGGGLAAMFTMMNSARLAVGVQGIAMGEAAVRHAARYAGERVQGRAHDGRPAGIDQHPDVRRSILVARAEVEAMRGLALVLADALDHADHGLDAASRGRAADLADLLIPVVKACGADAGIAAADAAIQVHGGHGYIEDSGAAQTWRDARITAIYEGTNGIQALDLVRRKLGRDRGQAALGFVGQVAAVARDLAAAAELEGLRRRLDMAVDALGMATRWMTAAVERDGDEAAAGASDYLRLFGVVAGGWIMARSALAARARLAQGPSAPLPPEVYRAKLISARIHADHVLPRATALAASATSGAALLRAIDRL